MIDEDDDTPPAVARCRPIRPLWPTPRVPCPDAWSNETVQAILQGILTEKAFDRLPILADALEEAGCEDELLLRHCRECSEHYGTCWVLKSHLPEPIPTFEPRLITPAQGAADEFITVFLTRPRSSDPPPPRIRLGWITGLALLLLLVIGYLLIYWLLPRPTPSLHLPMPVTQPPSSQDPQQAAIRQELERLAKQNGGKVSLQDYLKTNRTQVTAK